MFTALLYAIRGHGVPVGTHEWLAFLQGIRAGLATDLDGLYGLGRSVLCRTEADYDAFDVAFGETFRGAVLDPQTRARLDRWLAEAAERLAEAEDDDLVAPDLADEDLWEALRERLEEQDEEHHGGSHWVGTGGTSPFGHSGRASSGIRVGGKGGNRSAIGLAGQRRWQGYRTDQTLQTRDLEVALKMLRRLQREGRWELDLDGTIDRTAHNAGEIEIVERRERENQVRLVLLMDSGGSMTPHAERVTQLFTAAEDVGTFRSFKAYFFHNCVYNWLWADDDEGDRVPTADVLAGLTPRHRLIFVGDASMAPYELFSVTGWGFDDSARIPGLAWLRRFRKRCPSSVWLNPDPRRWWDHPTVSAIGRVFPMHELTVHGLRDAVATLRRPV